MNTSDDCKRFYGKQYTLFTAAETAILDILVDIENRYANANQRVPIEHYKSRIKSVESTKEKLNRLGLPGTGEVAIQNIFDLVGVRIICQFIDDIYALVNIIREHPSVEVVREKNYIKNPKSNGYRSLHMILRFSVLCFGVIYKPYVEIQMRTIAMDFWASLEHELKYKKDIPDTALISGELKRCADEIASVDLSMQTIHEWIQKSNSGCDSYDR